MMKSSFALVTGFGADATTPDVTLPPGVVAPPDTPSPVGLAGAIAGAAILGVALGFGVNYAIARFAGIAGGKPALKVAATMMGLNVAAGLTVRPLLPSSNPALSMVGNAALDGGLGYLGAVLMGQQPRAVPHSIWHAAIGAVGGYVLRK